MRQGRTRGAGGWAGVAALVGALALAVLGARGWGGHDAGRHPDPAAALVRAREAPAPALRSATAPAEAPATAAAEGGADARAPWRAAEVDGPRAGPELRLARELEPVQPDVVVALAPTGRGRVVVPHDHVAESPETRTPRALGLLDGGTAMPDGLTAGVEGMEGPEPGAVYWFGPEGLVKVKVLMEAQR